MDNKLSLSNQQINKITRDNIKDALMSLMKEKSFKSVTITELVKKAGVSRTAFYRNYESKEAILFEITENCISTVKKCFSEIKKHIDCYDHFLEMFSKIKEAKEEIDLAFKAHLHLDDLLPSENLFSKLLSDKNGSDRYGLIGLEGAFKAIIGDWIKNGMKESEEEMAHLCTRLFTNKAYI